MTAHPCLITVLLMLFVHTRACGAMDNASDYGSEDSRFESWQARLFCVVVVSTKAKSLAARFLKRYFVVVLFCSCFILLLSGFLLCFVLSFILS